MLGPPPSAVIIHLAIHEVDPRLLGRRRPGDDAPTRNLRASSRPRLPAATRR